MTLKEFKKLLESLDNMKKRHESLSPLEQEKHRKFRELMKIYQLNNSGSLKGFYQYLRNHGFNQNDSRKSLSKKDEKTFTNIDFQKIDTLEESKNGGEITNSDIHKLLF